jgi:hypothetical protein
MCSPTAAPPSALLRDLDPEIVGRIVFEVARRRVTEPGFALVAVTGDKSYSDPVFANWAALDPSAGPIERAGRVEWAGGPRLRRVGRAAPPRNPPRAYTGVDAAWSACQ